MTKYCKLSAITIEKNPEKLFDILGYITAQADICEEKKNKEFVFEGLTIKEWTEAIQNRINSLK